MATRQKTDYPRQDDYTGHSIWRVSHPDFGVIEVKARDQAGAITVAAAAWGARWQKYSFYAFCDVDRASRSK